MIKQSLSMPYSDKGQLAASICHYFTEWNSIREPAMQLWAEIDTYLHATDTSQIEGGANWDHKTFIPTLSEIHEDLLAIVYSTVLPHEDWLGWRGHDAKGASANKRKKVLSYIKHVHRLNGFRKSMRHLIDDLLRYGNCFAQLEYVNNTQDMDDGEVDIGYNGPVVKRISPYDIVFDPTASSFEVTPKIIRSVISIGEFKEWTDSLQEDSLDEEVVKNVLEARGSGSGANSITNRKKNEQYVPAGFGSIEEYYANGVVELLWFYGSIYDEGGMEVHKDRLVVVVDGDKVLFDKMEKNPRIFKGSWKPRADNLWSQGPLDNIVGMNFMINHRENAKNDAIDKFIHPDRAYIGDVEEIYDEVTGHTKYIMPEGGSVTDITPDTTILSYDSQIAMHQDMMRKAARLPLDLVGFRTPGEKTAFEVQNLNDGAFRGFINKAEQFEQEFLEPLVTGEIQIAKSNFSSVITVMAEDEEGILSVLEVTEEDLKSNGTLVPYGARRFSRNLQQLAGIDKLANTNLIQLIGKHVDSFRTARVWEELSGFNNFELVEKFSAIEEAVEEQQMTMMAQQEVAQSSSQPTMAEMELEEEDELQDTNVPE